VRVVGKLIISFSCLLFFSTISYAQNNFLLNGAAVKLSENCFQLTPNLNNIFGTAWYQQRVSLTKPFEITFNANFGCFDDGADGIAFVLQQQSVNAGGLGGGLGALGIAPSIAVEFDTYNNVSYADLIEDHVAITVHGGFNHNNTNTIAGPIAANSSGDIEDCKDHPIKIVWNPDDNYHLEVFFDCTLILDVHYDIVKNIFNNDPNVYWGFTSATGGRKNIHKVCITHTNIINFLPDYEMCKGDSVQFDGGDGKNFLWTPDSYLNNNTIRNPFAKPNSDISYVLKKEDTCGNTFYDTLNIVVNQNARPPLTTEISYLTKNCKDSAIVLEADTAFDSFRWNTTDTTNSIIAPSEGVFWVHSKGKNCGVTDTFIIKKICPSSFWVPNVFSPNADNYNDYWYADCENCFSYRVEIFNRWGERVFESNLSNAKWDGTFKGKNCPEGIYFYIVNYSNLFEERKLVRGSISLFR
jgi:gliding motility-associated-like protein